MPIAPNSKGLSDRLAADVCVAIPQRAEKRERGGEVASLRELERSEQTGLLEQVVSGMQEAKRACEPPGRGIALLRAQLGRLSQSDRGHEDQDKPDTAADKSRHVRLQDPRHSGDQQHREGGDAPAARSIRRFSSPGRARSSGETHAMKRKMWLRSSISFILKRRLAKPFGVRR